MRHTSGASRILAVALVMASVGATGCGIHLYNPQDDALTKKASETFTAANVAQYIVDQRDVLHAMHARDIGATRQNVIAERNALLIYALDETAENILKTIDERIKRLGYPSDVAIQQTLHDLPSKLRQAMIARDAYLVAIRTSATPIKAPAFPPTDEDVESANAAGGSISPWMVGYKASADAYIHDAKTLKDISSGVIGEINRQIRVASEIDMAVKRDLASVSQDLEIAIGAYKSAVAKPTTLQATIDDLLKKVIEARDKLDSVVSGDLRKKAADAGFEDLLAQVPLERLIEAEKLVGEYMSEFASGLASGQSGNSEGQISKAQAAGQSVAVLLNLDKQIKESTVRAKLVPLTFEQGRIRIEKERLQRKVERGKQRVVLLERQRTEAIAESMKLVDARNELNKAAGGNAAQMIEDLVKGNDKSSAVHAILVLGESVGVHRLKREELEVGLISLNHDEALDASESALALWQHTIASPLEELVNFHASGLKAEDLARLIQAASLVGVAVGVN